MANSEMELFNDSDFITLPQGENKGDVMVRPSVSYWSDVWRRICSDRVAMVSLAVITIIALMAVFAPILCPYKYETTDLLATNLGPCREHWFGTDSLGRDRPESGSVQGPLF